MSNAKVAIAGVGNAASAFVQALGFYKGHHGQEKIKFLSYPEIGGLAVHQIDIVAAFDIANGKVGSPLNKAIMAAPNVTKHYVDESELINFSTVVQKGPLEDGINPTTAAVVKEDPRPPVDIAKVLESSSAEILICLLPSGADKAVYAYAEAALKANCAFINCTPTVVASSQEWAQKFKKVGISLVGDDLQSQLGGTRIHKGILEVLKAYGAQIIQTYNLDVSGGTEGLLTLDSGHRTQLMKSKIKSESIRKIVPYLTTNDITTGTTDYLDFLGNQRIGHFWIKVKDFLDDEIHIDLTVKSYDGPNAAGTLIDVVRGTKLALTRALDGPLISISAYGFKNPPLYFSEATASSNFYQFLIGNRVL